MLYMVTFTINIPQMLAYIPAPWILWDTVSSLDRPGLFDVHLASGNQTRLAGKPPAMWAPQTIAKLVYKSNNYGL